jgi:cytochrome c oxidase subunit I
MIIGKCGTTDRTSLPADWVPALFENREASILAGTANARIARLSGRLHFWIFIIGFHVTFEPGRGWDIWNLIVTIGVFFQAAGVLVFIGNLIWSYLQGKLAGSDPWAAWTLEWSTTSPPPTYNFAVIPEVRSRRPLWDLKHPDDPDWQYE